VKVDHHEFVPRGETVNKQYYTEVIKLLRGSEKKKSRFVEKEKMDSPPRKRSRIFFTAYSRDHIPLTTSGLARSRTCSHPSVPEAGIHIERSTFGSVENIQVNSLA